MIAASVVIIGGGLWLLAMPYPIRQWWWSKLETETQWSPARNVSEADFIAAKLVVKKELRFWEIITSVTIVTPDEIRFHTMSYWRGPETAAGRILTVKKMDGSWRLTEKIHWIS